MYHQIICLNRKISACTLSTVRPSFIWLEPLQHHKTGGWVRSYTYTKASLLYVQYFLFLKHKNMYTYYTQI